MHVFAAQLAIWVQFQNLIFYALEYLYRLTGDWGVAIILLTVAIRILILPLTIKQTSSMYELQKIQPKIKALQEKYKGDKEKTKKTFDEEGYFTVGDVGYFNEDGYLFLCDRKSDMIIAGGINIYPAEIESCIHEVANVADVAVFGIPHEDLGEQILAVEVHGAQHRIDGVAAARRNESVTAVG